MSRDKIYVIEVRVDEEVTGLSDIEQALYDIGAYDIELREEYNY